MSLAAPQVSRGAQSPWDVTLLGRSAAESKGGFGKSHPHRAFGVYSAARAFGRASRMSFQRLDGESGSSRASAPSDCSAEATALAMTPPTGMMPPSPAPLAPSGLIGEGSSSIRKTRMLGKSLAVGIK